MKIIDHQRIDGVIPNARAQRPFPTAALAHFDPFVMLDHIGPSTMPADWHLDGGTDQQPRLHPHRGFETITFMLKGNMHHRDSKFSERPLLTNGSVQQMNAGSGIAHGGDMWADEQQQFHEIQLWVNNPAKNKMSEPSIHNVSDANIPVVKVSSRSGEVMLRIVAGSLEGVKGPIKTFANIRAIHGIASGRQTVKFAQPQLETTHNRTMLYLLSGSATINGDLIKQFQAAAFEQPLTQLEFTATDAEFLLISGQSLNETIVFGGPFVMNTDEEIEQAKRDFAMGLF
ncbi:MAG: pirin family protein [Pseudomonadales bacterium]|nr:pirin family protein [Pseudomonadales bacterium]NRA14091.1 pirin family protein [Oceanospirillaceae bacterium]